MKITRCNVRLVELRFAKAVGGSSVRGVDVVVVELRDSDGGSGLGFTYVIGGTHGWIVAAIARKQAETFLLGHKLISPRVQWHTINASFNRTGDGPNVVALAALDMALWDLTARRAQVPLCVALGGKPAAVPVYASGGFNPNASPEETAEVAARHIANGFSAVKPRVNARVSDRAVLEAVRSAVGDEIGIMADANEKGDSTSARRLLELASDLGLRFVEEPLPARDVMGLRSLINEGYKVPIATGEHLQGYDRFQVTLADGTSVIQPDLAMAGGLTPCLEIAQLAAECGVLVAPHFLPGLFVHMNGSFKGSLLLEDFSLVEAVFMGFPSIVNGEIAPRNVSGHGLKLRETISSEMGSVEVTNLT